MRARTRRLKSLLVGIVSVLWSGHGPTAPQQRRSVATQRFSRCRSGSIPPFASRGPSLGEGRRGWAWIDRKSTRLNSSHGYISYAVFCLKKKKKHQEVECEARE